MKKIVQIKKHLFHIRVTFIIQSSSCKFTDLSRHNSTLVSSAVNPQIWSISFYIKSQTVVIILSQSGITGIYGDDGWKYNVQQATRRDSFDRSSTSTDVSK